MLALVARATWSLTRVGARPWGRRGVFGLYGFRPVFLINCSTSFRLYQSKALPMFEKKQRSEIKPTGSVREAPKSKTERKLGYYKC